MKVYTSYFAHSGSNPNAICISNGNPCGLPVLQWAVPSWDLVNKYKLHVVDELGYEEQYVRQLDNNEEKILNALVDGGIYCCYEKWGKFCHRHIFAKWLMKRGIEVMEV